MAKKAYDQQSVQPAGFCVYIGPTIIGVIQSGTIYNGSLYAAKHRAAEAIKKFPLIGALIISGENLPAAKRELAEGGNHLGIIYRRLAKEASKRGGNNV